MNEKPTVGTATSPDGNVWSLVRIEDRIRICPLNSNGKAIGPGILMTEAQVATELPIAGYKVDWSDEK